MKREDECAKFLAQAEPNENVEVAITDTRAEEGLVVREAKRAPRLRLFVVWEENHARAKSIEPNSENEFLQLAERIAASVSVRRAPDWKRPVMHSPRKKYSD